MPLDITSQAIAITYHHANPDDDDPDQDQLSDWHVFLDSEYGKKLDGALAAAGLPVGDQAVNSVIIILAQVSNGSTPGNRLKNACKYFVNVSVTAPIV